MNMHNRANGGSIDAGRFSVQQICQVLNNRLVRQIEENAKAKADDGGKSNTVELDLSTLRLKDSPDQVCSAAKLYSLLAVFPCSMIEASMQASRGGRELQGLSPARLFVAALHLAHHHNHHQVQLQQAPASILGDDVEGGAAASPASNATDGILDVLVNRSHCDAVIEAVVLKLQPRDP
eukprot:SAG11_NODE_928_length_6510_cov_5.490251_5_plen_179_part_00